MKTCILTLIKDEHEYLKDFIEYHLSIGIDDIFFLEDIDSKSHYDIVKHYNNVKLLKASEIIPIDTILPLKKHGAGFQSIYDSEVMDYIYLRYDFDWCFLIDIDEFITIDEPLEQILSDYSEYEALMLQWKNYGCSGHIYKPKYDKPIWEIYDKECNFLKKDKERFKHTKVCYNMKKFKMDFVINCHFPDCEFVKPNFSKDRFSEPCYDRIYIRHYITKSFEEYIWKLFVRGITIRDHRKIDDFFEMNPEMNPKKEEMLKLVDTFIDKY